MGETIRSLEAVQGSLADQSALRDLLASIRGCFASMDTAGVAVTKNVTTSYVAFTGFTNAKPAAQDCVADTTAGTITITSPGFYLVWANFAAIDANESDTLSVAIHVDGQAKPQLFNQGTMIAATTALPISLIGIIRLPKGNEVLDLRFLGAAGTTGSSIVCSWGLKRVG